MKLRMKIQKRIALLLTLCLLFELIPMPVFAMVIDAVECIPAYERVLASEVTNPYTRTDEPTTDKSLEELKASADVTLDKDGASLINPDLPLSIFEDASELHGGQNLLNRELAALSASVEVDGLSEENVADIRQLICSGYTYRQAQAALVTAEILEISLSELCTAKEAELENQVGFVAGEIDELAVRLGVPVSIVVQHVSSYGNTKQNILDAFRQAMDTRYEQFARTNLTGTESSSGKSAASAHEEETFVEYLPEQILENPYNYKEYGNLHVNLATGSYHYVETDLFIPGINGLDLNITRAFNADYSYSEIPCGRVADDSEDTLSIEVSLDIYISNDGETFIAFVPTDSSFSVVSSNGNIYNVEDYTRQYIAPDFLDAVEYQNQLQSDFEGNIYSATNDDGSTVWVKLMPTIKAIGQFEYVFSNEAGQYNYYTNEYGLGHGWRLGFSALEVYREGLDQIGYRRLILQDGRIYKCDFDLSSPTVAYVLEDMTLSRALDYAGAEYLLTYADGKKEYFDNHGRNIAIVDRYDNKITLEYTTTNSGKTVTQIKITDTLGNVVIYKQEPLLNVNGDGNGTIPGVAGDAGIYSDRWSLTLNGDTIRTYYSYRAANWSPHHLRVVEDELGQYTIFDTAAESRSFNCFVKSPSTNSSFITDNELRSVRYPNGLRLELTQDSSTGSVQYEMLGSVGYQTSSSLSGITYTYGDAQQNRRTFRVGDYSGHSGLWDDDTRYTTEETFFRAVASGEDEFVTWKSHENKYTFNPEHEMLEETSRLYSTMQEDEYPGGNLDRPLTGIHTVTTYEYTDAHLPSNITVKTYEPGSSSYHMPQTYAYTYDDKKNILSETLPNGMTTTYSYDDTYNVLLGKTYQQDADTTITEENTLTVNKKDIQETVVKTNGTTTGKTKYSYDTRGRITQLRNYRSATDYTIQTLSYDGGAQATQIEILYVKNADGANAESTEGFDPGTLAERYTYNTRGWPTSYIDGNGRTTTIVYDETGRITRVNYPDGSADCYSYDTANNTVTYTNANGHAVTYKYDPFGNLIELYDDTSEQAIATYAYDSLGNRVLETLHSTNSAKDQSTYTYYDGLGRLLEIGIRNTDGTNTPLESYTYQAARGKTTQTVHGSTGAPDQVSTAYVDCMGNVIHTGRIYNGVEYTDTYAYDYLGNRIQETSAYTTSRDGTYSMRYEYDHMGNVLRATNALGDSEINTYDWTGNLVTSQDNKGNTTSYSYDELGRLLTVTTPIDNDGNSVVKYYYDAAGNLTSQLTSSGTSSSSNQFTSVLYTYDSMNRLTGVEMPVNSAASDYSAYTYDPAGNILSVKTGYQKTAYGLSGTPSTTSYTYDRFGNVLTITDPEGMTETYTYDLNGSVLTKRDRNNILTTYTYDNRGRLTAEAIGSSISRGYTYGLNGSLLSQSEGSDTITYVYDALGRKTQETAGGYTKNYTYNIGGLRTNFTVKKSGTTLLNNSYTYDDLGRMTRVSGSGVTADYTFDDNSNLSTVAYNNGVTQSYSYNMANLVTQTTSATTADTLSRYQYSYDLAGRQIGITDLENRVTTYQYDDLGRLTSESRTAGSAGGTAYAKSYTYDSYGNRATMTADGETTVYEYDLANRLRCHEINGEYTDYYYDYNGNLIEKQPSFIVPFSYVQNGQSALETQAVDNFAVYYSYNEADQLVRMTQRAPIVSYSYYADGLRKNKTAFSTTTTYVWDGDQLVLEITGSTVKKYIRGLTLAGCVTGGSKSYYQYDAHGNVVQLTDASGAVTQSYDYDAFGNQFSPSLTDSNMFRYSGEYFDEETEFYYLRARQYSPAIGRFTQEDTYRGEYANPLSLNLYTYCYNDPVQYVDPTGHFAWDTFFDIWSLSASVAKFLVIRTLDNLVSVAIDAVALAIPYVPSAVVSTAVEYTAKLVGEAYQSVMLKLTDDIVEDTKIVIDEIHDVVNKVGSSIDEMVEANKTGKSSGKSVSSRPDKIVVNPKDPWSYLQRALQNRGYASPPNDLHTSWLDNGYQYTVRTHVGDPRYTDEPLIFRVSRQSTMRDVHGQGTGMEYLGTDGNWYHKSILTEFHSGGVRNPNFNEEGARMTHIPVKRGG